MTATINLAQIMLAPGQSILFKDITWLQFEDILEGLEEKPAFRLAYNCGLLEIMVPLPEHEYFKETIGDLIKDLASELEIDYESFGSTTWRRQSQMAGAEPDQCFYIQSLPAILGRIDINLNQDPPPDLVLEIDITSKSLDSLPIYARLGISEVWRYHRERLVIYHLDQLRQIYNEMEKSLVFPNFPVKQIPNFIRQNLGSGRRVLRQRFQEWVKVAGIELEA